MDAASPTPTSAGPPCRTCGGRTILWGRDRKGSTRHRCKACGATYADVPPRPLGSMRLDPAKATLCLSLLVEGSSIRSTERVTGVHRDTIMRLLVVAGTKAEAALNRLVQRVEVKDVQADEIWSYVAMKEKTKWKAGITSPRVGDAYTFVGVERSSKIVLAWHLGRRTSQDTHHFMTKLDCATSGRFQLSTDGFDGYPDAVDAKLGARVDFAQLIKSYSADGSEERRYSPPRIIATEKRVVSGIRRSRRSARRMSSGRT